MDRLDNGLQLMEGASRKRDKKQLAAPDPPSLTQAKTAHDVAEIYREVRNILTELGSEVHGG